MKISLCLCQYPHICLPFECLQWNCTKLLLGTVFNFYSKNRVGVITQLNIMLSNCSLKMFLL